MCSFFLEELYQLAPLGCLDFYARNWWILLIIPWSKKMGHRYLVVTVALIQTSRLRSQIFHTMAITDFLKLIYYMAISVSGKDELNRALWLATRACKMKLSCQPGFTRRVPPENFPDSQIINPLLTKHFQSRWRDIGLVLNLRVNGPRLRRSVHENALKKNLANIQLSWPDAWSKTHIHKITELLRTPSLVDTCVLMRICKHGCDVLDWRVLWRIIL